MTNGWFWGLLLSMAVIVSSSAHARPISLGTDTDYRGYLTQGQRFGVAIGQSREQAKQTLIKSGFEYAGVVDCSYWRLKETIDCRSGDQSDAYSLRNTFRHGELYVSFADDKVTAIIWSFYLLPYVDW